MNGLKPLFHRIVSAGKHPDRRVHPRCAWLRPITYVYSGRKKFCSATARAVNVSRTGICMETDAPIQPGTRLYISMKRTDSAPPSSPFEAAGRAFIGTVAWSDSGPRPNGRCRVGISCEAG